MKIQVIVWVSLVSLLTIGCQKEVSVNQPSEGSVAQATSSPIVETSTSTTPESGNVKSGTFVSGEKPTEGTVRIVTQNNQSVLELDQTFKTSEMGPDLVVILHRSDNVISSTKPPAYALKEGDYVVLAPLKKFSGAQSYPIPRNINLDDYKSAAIWCRKFNATFGAAQLSS